MAFLGAYPVGANLTIRVAWTLAPGSPSTSGSSLSLVHEDGGSVVGPVVGVADGVDAYKASVQLPRSGRWRVRWASVPTGGSSDDVIYAQ